MKPQFLIFPLIENKEYTTRVTGITDDRLTQEERQDVGKKT